MKLHSFILFAVFAVTYAADLLFVDSLVPYYSEEITAAKALGYVSEIVTVQEWRGMKTKDFAAYKAIIISDPSPGSYKSSLGFLEDTADTWGPAVQGNIIIHGTDASKHHASILVSQSIKFAASGQSSTGSKQTGLFMSLSQYYDVTYSSTVDSLKYFGEFKVRGLLDCYDDSHIVAFSPAIQNLTDKYLSNWGCSVHEAFSSYPTTGKSGFQALAIADGVTGQGTQNYGDGHFGLPYIISRGATPAGCGDGKWDASVGEECDDGNTRDGDGCDKSCRCESGHAKGDGTCWPMAADPSGLVVMPDAFIDVDYFTATYLCVVVTVIFKTLWGIVLASTKMIEPFMQLHALAGATAAESLLSDYLSSGMSMESLRNVFRGHWVMTLTTGVFVAATMAMAVASESMTIQSGNSCTTPEEPLKCDLQWVIDTKVARTLQALMALSAAMILARAILGRKRTSGIVSYPCTIASMAALLSNPEVLKTFKDIEPDAKVKDICKALENYRYSIKEYTVDGNTRYGLICTKTPPIPESKWSKVVKFLKSPLMKKSDDSTAKGEKKSPYSLWDRVLHATFLAIHIALLALLLSYRLSDHNDDLFMNKTRFGPRFLMSSTCILLGIQWGRLESEVRVMTPYRKLASKSKSKTRLGASHEQIHTMHLHGVPLTALFRALWNGNLFHALIALVAILSQVLVISITGVPYNFGVIQNPSIFSSTISVGLLGLMIVTGLSMIWWRRSNPVMPGHRTPDTLASVIMMICASKMLTDFQGIGGPDGKLPASEQDLLDKIEGKYYTFGKKVDSDGKNRIMIDVVEMESDSDSSTEPPGEAGEAGEAVGIVESR